MSRARAAAGERRFGTKGGPKTPLRPYQRRPARAQVSKHPAGAGQGDRTAQPNEKPRRFAPGARNGLAAKSVRRQPVRPGTKNRAGHCQEDESFSPSQPSRKKAWAKGPADSPCCHSNASPGVRSRWTVWLRAVQRVFCFGNSYQRRCGLARLVFVAFEAPGKREAPKGPGRLPVGGQPPGANPCVQAPA